MLKAISIKQPWAQLIAKGAKDIENREWPTSLRGRIAIHASAKLTKADIADACDVMKVFIPRFSAMAFASEAVTYPLGSIIGTAEIVDCVVDSGSPWFFGRYGFRLVNPIMLAEPIKIKGALGFWAVPDDVAAKIREAGAV